MLWSAVVKKLLRDHRSYLGPRREAQVSLERSTTSRLADVIQTQTRASDLLQKDA